MSPADMARKHVRVTIQPFDAPPTRNRAQIAFIEEIGSDDMLSVFDRLTRTGTMTGTMPCPPGLPEFPRPEDPGGQPARAPIRAGSDQ